MLSDLGARAHKGMRVDHGAFVNICSYVYICRRHHDHRRSEVCACAHAASAWNDPDAVLRRETSCRDGILVKKRKLSLSHVSKLSKTESRKDHLLYPGVNLPLPVYLLRNPDLATLKIGNGLIESFYICHNFLLKINVLTPCHYCDIPLSGGISVLPGPVNKSF